MSVKYDEYIEQHKVNVCNALRWLKENLPENIFPKEVQDKIDAMGSFVEHDASKNYPEEYEAYDNYFYGNKSYDVVSEFDYAWLHHIHSNKHHWQYWVLLNDDPQSGERLLEIPDVYIFEMICDWWSFSWKSGNLYEIFNWYAERKNYMRINELSKMKIANILDCMFNILQTFKHECPNPEGKEGICYAFDRFGDRNGCAAAECKLLTPELYKSQGDPLPGLTSMLENNQEVGE